MAQNKAVLETGHLKYQLTVSHSSYNQSIIGHLCSFWCTATEGAIKIW